MTTEIRETGLEAIPEVPWGTHICQFYKTAEDLLSVTLPFMRAGLENNEYCLWVAWEPLGTAQVIEALTNNLPDPTVLFDGRQIEVVSHCAPEFQRGFFEAGGFVEAVRERIERAIAMGYRGARIADNFSWNHEVEWCGLIDGERVAAKAMAQFPVIALCSYPTDACTGFQMKDVGGAHHYVLVSVGGQCEVINGGQHGDDIQGSEVCGENHYREAFENMLDGMVLLDSETMQGLLANNAAARILGFDSAGEMVGVNPFRSFTGRGGQKVTAETLRSLLQSEHHRVREISGITREGRAIRVSYFGVRTEYRGRQAGFIAVRDMTGGRNPTRKSPAPEKCSDSPEIVCSRAA